MTQNNDLVEMMLDSFKNVPMELRDIAVQCGEKKKFVNALSFLHDMHHERESPRDWFPLLILWLNTKYYVAAANKLKDINTNQQPFTPPLELPTTASQFEQAVIKYLSNPHTISLSPVLERICINAPDFEAGKNCITLSRHPWIVALKREVKAPLAEIFTPKWKSDELEKVPFYHEDSLFN